MPPSLTHLKPPAPTHSIHESEVNDFAEKFALELSSALVLMLDRIIYPRTMWGNGAGISVSKGLVTAKPNPISNDTDQPVGVYEVGAIPVTTAALAGRSVFLAYWEDGGPRKVDTRRRKFYDGVLAGPRTGGRTATPPDAKSMSAIFQHTGGEVVTTAPSAMEVDDESGYYRHVNAWADYFADMVLVFVQEYLLDHWFAVTRYWWGTAESVNTSARVVTVLLDAVGDDPARSQVCAFGTRMWTKSMIEGKYVRVGVNPREGWWVDDLA